MKYCVIFDNVFDIERVAHSFFISPSDSFTFFPLMSDFMFLEKLRAAFPSDIKNNIVDVPILIESEIANFRTELFEWSHRMGEISCLGKKLKEWLLAPDQGVSAWWFGQLSETNNVQTDLFLKMIQIKIIKKYLKENPCDSCILCIATPDLTDPIKKVCRQLNVPVKLIKLIDREKASSFKNRLKHILATRLGSFGNLLTGICYFFHFFRQGKQARKILGPLEPRVPLENPFLFVSYFPAIEKAAAAQGIFKNKFALPLQKLLQEHKRCISWLMMPVQYDEYDYQATLRLAKKFSDNGEVILIFQEFATFSVLLRGLWWWFKQWILSFVLYPFFIKRALVDPFLGVEQRVLLKRLWNLSISGSSGQFGIFYYLMYKELFATIPHINQCLYYLEMQNWEKALNAAKKMVQPQVKTLGFQHAALSVNYFSYFYSSQDTFRYAHNSDLPLPDLLLANGEITATLLASCQYPQLYQVESIRYLYLNDIVHFNSTNPVKRELRPILLVSGTMNASETKALLSLVYVATAQGLDIEVWIKGHPSLSVEKLCASLGINFREKQWKICKEDIREILPFVHFVLIPDGSISFEALAFGCQVLIPIFANIMPNSPLIYFPEYCRIVTSIESLVDILKSFKVAELEQQKLADKHKQFLRRYWNLEMNMSKWKQILEIADV